MHSNRKKSLRTAWPLMATLLFLLAACGDPAPGEGMEKKPMEEPEPKVVAPSEALQKPDLTKTDLDTLEESEIEEVVPTEQRCVYRYTAESPPVFAAGITSDSPTAVGVIKIHGKLVEMKAEHASSLDALASGGTFTADDVTVEVTRDDSEGETTGDDKYRWPADLRFELKQGLRVDYHGWLSCPGKPHDGPD